MLFYLAAKLDIFLFNHTTNVNVLTLSGEIVYKMSYFATNKMFDFTTRSDSLKQNWWRD